ncbi:hypothetical protein, partial [Streptococcus pneumoniae]|uniref:hypothetical protein n=1 Tax=Streptococcus pneumoniae TaxID=1313 RepID=UPI0018B0295E
PDGRIGSVSQSKDGDVWVNVLNFRSRESKGSAVYAAVANYAANNDLTVRPDPDGLSDAAMIRRTEHMLSAALKFGPKMPMSPDIIQTN